MSQYSDSAYTDDPNSSWNKVYGFVREGSSILDIGCSSGNFGEVLIKEKQCIVDGVEIDGKDLAEAKKKLRNVYQLNIETDDLSVIKGTYDYIYFGDVIEHLVNPTETLKRLKPLFKNAHDAKLLFSLPNMSHVSVRLMLLNGKFEYGRTGLLDDTHLHFYTLDELNRVFNRAGMEIQIFDPVIKDYPKELLDKELSVVGLENTKTFTEFVNSTNASIYQLVGIAGYAVKPKKVLLKQSSPRDKFSSLLKETTTHYQERLVETNKHIGKLEKEINRLSQENEELQKRLNEPVLRRALRKLSKQDKR